MFRNRVQLFHPIRRRWVKLDSSTGRIVDEKVTPGPWAKVKVYEPKQPAARSRDDVA